ncbi:uncharacterized [Tachysurus ichikawai]
MEVVYHEKSCPCSAHRLGRRQWGDGGGEGLVLYKIYPVLKRQRGPGVNPLLQGRSDGGRRLTAGEREEGWIYGSQVPIFHRHSAEARAGAKAIIVCKQN